MLSLSSDKKLEISASNIKVPIERINVPDSLRDGSRMNHVYEIWGNNE
jgi:hypothetical protein